MNVIGSQDHPVAAEVWQQREMRAALAARDISTVYRLLRRVGVSQRQIAALTGQSQSEVSEILKGRQVMAYDVLARIADGLGVPRGYMGLAYDEATATTVVGPPDDGHAEEDESVKRRKFLANTAAVMFGAASLKDSRSFARAASSAKAGATARGSGPACRSPSRCPGTSWTAPSRPRSPSGPRSSGSATPTRGGS